MDIRIFVKKTIFVFLAVFLSLSCLGMLSIAFAQDEEWHSDPPPYSADPQIYKAELKGETKWHVDVNSGCSFSDHNINLDIDEEPDKIKDAKIKLTTYDVDYNDPQSCAGGPEVDYLYVNGNFIGQLKGANNAWSTNVFNISSSFLVKGTNLIYIDTDAPGTGCWCVGVGFVEITGKVDFQVIDYTPPKNQKNVKWNDSNITIEFSREVKASTANSNSIKLDYRNQAGSWVEVNTTITMTSADKAKVTPNSDLKDGIKYRMRVLNGPNGILDKDDNELKNAVEWFFWTMVDLEGDTASPYAPNTTTEKMQITWFNVSRNKDLVPIKTVVNRNYALWDKKDDVFDADEVTEFKANVTLETNGSAQTENNYTIKRPDKYSANEKRMAQNTINFQRLGSTGSKEDYKLKIEPVPQHGTPKVFEKTATANVKSKRTSIKFNTWACEMAGWYNGVNNAELTSAKNELNEGCDFVHYIFPILGCAYDYKGEVVRGSGGFDMTYTTTKYSAWWKGNVRFVNIPHYYFWTKEIEEIKHVANYLAGLKPWGHDFIVGLVPSDGIPGATGVRIGKTLLLSESNFNAGTVAHEIGHFFGLSQSVGTGCTPLHNNDPTVIEGFNVYANKNKSYTEGNSETAKFNLNGCIANTDGCPGAAVNTPVAPLMNKCANATNRRWIRPENYEHLLGQLAVAAVASMASLTGDYMVVTGYTNASGDLELLNPLYNVTQRHIDAPSGTGFTVKLFSGENGTGTLISSDDFNTDEMVIHKDDGSISTIDSQMFAFTILFDDAAQSFVITGPNNSLTINKSDVGVAAPTANFTNPTNGDTISGTVNVTWTGSDDGGTVYYRLEYSPDNGITWIPISSQIVDITSYNVDTTLLPGGSKLALIASDGFNTTRKEIDVTLNNFVTVKSTTPLDGETDVSEGQTVAAYFVSDMDETTINDTTFLLLEGSTGVAGQVAYNSVANRAMFTPTNSLKSNTTYTARLLSGAGGVKDLKGNELATNFQWSFTTGRAPVNPQVEDVSPEHGVADVPINALIQATFEKDIDATTVDTNSFIVMDEDNTAVGGTVSYNSTTKSAVFTPDADLDPNTTFTATLTTAIADPQGLPLESDFSWSFMTGSDRSIGIRIVKVSSDIAEDTDNDGLFDKLLIRVKVEVINTGNYNLNAQLKDKDGEDIEWTSTTQFFSQSGVYFMELEYNGINIASHGVDGPYELDNISISNTSDSSIFDLFEGSYQTFPYEADAFFTVIRFSGIPEIAVAVDSTNEDLLNLEAYATHTTYNVSDLDYRILINSNLDAGASKDASNNVDVNPVAGFSGYSDVLVEAKDQDGVRALDSFRAGVLKSYKFANAGWYLISLTSQPADTNIATVLAAISGKYDAVWAYINESPSKWKLYAPSLLGFSDLETMEAGKGYWIHLNQAADLSTLGLVISSQSINIVKGWNLRGLNSTSTIATADALASIAGRYLSVWAYIDGTWKFYDPNNPGSSTLTNMEPGYGYWINAILDTVWTLP